MNAPFEQPLPPHNLDAEQELLGALLINNDVLDRISTLQAVDFFHKAHRRIFTAAVTLIQRGEVASPVTLKVYFEKDGILEAIGGPAYLARLVGSVTTVVNAPDHARVIADLALRRRLIAIGQEITLTAGDPLVSEPAMALLQRLQGALEETADGSAADDVQVHSLGDLALQALENVDRVAKGGHYGLGTGIPDLDNEFGGMAKGQLIIIAGRPSMGKTALAFQVAKNAARTGHGALVVSLEMAGDELAERSLAERSGIAYSDMRTRRAARIDMAKLTTAQRTEAALPIKVIDRPGLSVSDIRRVARRLQRRGTLDLVVVDHLGLVRPRRDYRNRVEAITEITLDLKRLAKELDLPVVALCQLSRAVEGREDKRPVLADLRDSGSIEQDADAVLFVYREEYYLRDRAPKIGTAEWDSWDAKLQACRGECEIIIAKQRQGPAGKARVFYDPATNRFLDLNRRIDYRQGDFDL